jgi:hypothetical protein
MRENIVFIFGLTSGVAMSPPDVVFNDLGKTLHNCQL